MTELTLPAVVLLLLGLATRFGYARALALGGVPVAGAAVVAGETAIPVFYFMALAAALWVVALLVNPALGDSDSIPRTSLPRMPVVGLLGVLFAWCVVLTLTAPLALDGMTVVANGKSNFLRAGQLTSSNFAQLVYLAISISVVIYLIRAPRVRPEIVGLTVGGTVVLSFWRYLHLQYGVPFPEGVFDNSPAYSFIETEAGGGERFRGILTEPAGLGGACLSAIAYFTARLPEVSGWRKAGAIAVTVAAIFMGIDSTSATFVVAGALLVVMAAVSFVIPWIARRVSLSVVGTLGLLLLTAMAVWALPQVGAYVSETVDEKVGTSSFDDRGAADSRAFENFLDSGGMGTGIGSSRGSAFFPNLLANIGLIGVALFVFTVLTLVVTSWRHRTARPLIWTLLSILVVKAISGPDLSDPSGVLWVSIGLLARLQWRHKLEASASQSAQTISSASVQPLRGTQSDRI